MNSTIPTGYSSPRWSGEILDCSMPMTFDQYSRCSFDCKYCFSYFQRSLKEKNPLYTKWRNRGTGYLANLPTSVDADKFIALFTGEQVSQFTPYIQKRIAFQWGGLSDPFDMFEKKYKIGLKIMQALSEMQYPICFSTKSTWWTESKEYIDCFKRAKGAWNVKVSIICLNEDRAKAVEVGVPSPEERLKAIKRIALFNPVGGATLRLRPFILGISDGGYGNKEHLELIKLAGQYKATALSTEFLCIEMRANGGLGADRYNVLSKAAGMDLITLYKQIGGAGYQRLNYKIKEPYILEMKTACHNANMRFYVSDAHWKDQCDGGSCCGMKSGYQPAQWTELLAQARKRWDKGERNIEFTWEDLNKEGIIEELFSFKWRQAENFNTSSSTQRTTNWTANMSDWIKNVWNKPSSQKGPYNYFSGLLTPVRVDKNGNMVYKYVPYKLTSE